MEEELSQMSNQVALVYVGQYRISRQNHSSCIFHLYPAFQPIEDETSLLDRYRQKHVKYFWATDEVEHKAWGYFWGQRVTDALTFIKTITNDSAMMEWPSRQKSINLFQ